MDNETELWKSLPGVPGIEVSTIGRVRTLDKVVSTEKMTRFRKGKVLKLHETGNGYLQAQFYKDGKHINRYVHRLIAQTFIPNPNSLPEINHKDNNPSNNEVSNLEWCTREYNMAYKEKYGISAKECVPKSPVYAVNLKTQETLRFDSQKEASRVLGLNVGNINSVIKGKYKQTGGYRFENVDAE